MKAFMDLFFTNRMSRKPYAEMFAKRAVVISTAAGAGAKKATKPIETMLLYRGVPKGYRYAAAVRATGWDGVPEKTKSRILKDLKSLGRRLSDETAPGVPSRKSPCGRGDTGTAIFIRSPSKASGRTSGSRGGSVSGRRAPFTRSAAGTAPRTGSGSSSPGSSPTRVIW